MNRRALPVPLILLALALSAFQARAATLEVHDDSGAAVRLSHPAERIVSLSPHATELVYEVGAGAQLVGTSDASDHPKAALAVPRVGGASGFDLEAIARLHPDLVIAWSSGNSRQQIESLKRLGLAVFESDPTSVEEIATSLERLGQLTGHAREGISQARAVRDGIAALGAGPRSAPPVRVFYQVWNQPLYTLGGPHLVSRLINLCGGINIFTDVNALAPEVGAEAVLSRQPELIVTDPEHVAEVRAAWLGRGLQHAGQPDAVAGIDADLLTRPTARIVEGARALCQAIDTERNARARSGAKAF